MNFDTHPRQIQRYREAKPAVAGIPNFRCKACGKSCFVFAGRKRVYRGWLCVECQK